MKKYLFDEIYVGSDGKTAFKSFRKLSFVECFTCRCGQATPFNHSGEIWLFYPQNFKEFLNCLTLTKTCDLDYIINCKRANEEKSFDNLLTAFARYVYDGENITREGLVDFYGKAKDIKKATVANRVILEKDIEEIK